MKEWLGFEEGAGEEKRELYLKRRGGELRNEGKRGTAEGGEEGN